MKTVHYVEPVILRKSNPDYPVYIDMAYLANNTHNLGTYCARQWFFRCIKVSNKKLENKFKELNDTGENTLYSKLNEQVCQQTLKKIVTNFRSFFKANKKFKKHPKDFTGRPNVPGYHHKGVPCAFWIDNQDFKYDESTSTVLIHSNNKEAIWWKHKLHNIKLNPNLDMDHIGQIEVIPNRYYVKLLIEYSFKIPDCVKDNHRYMGIDLGVNNLACCGFNVKDCHPFIVNGRLVKSINQYANKKIAQDQRCLAKCNHRYTSHHLDFLYTKRAFKLYYLCHEASKYIVDYALNHDISRIIIGSGVLGSKQKSNMGKRNNQNFIQIPFRKLINDIKYKAAKCRIKVIVTEESYTSQSSFIDHEKPCKSNGNKARAKRNKAYIKKYHKPLYDHVVRRLKRGLYESDSGKYINADLNGALQIIKKVFPKAYARGIAGLVKVPLKINL